MSVNDCIANCLRGQRPDKPPDVFRLERIVEEAEIFIAEADDTRAWMLNNDLDPGNPSDVLIVISMLVTRRSGAPELAGMS